MPFNVAAGNSSGYNYASGRLDHQTYFKSIRVEQSQMARTVLDRILYAWLREAILIESYLPNSLRSLDSSFEHQWFWGGHEHVDPAKEANAQRIRLANHTKTLAHEYARQGRDWEAELKQRAKELALIRELSLSLDSTLMQDTGMRLLRHSIHTQFNYLSASRRKFDMSELDPVEPVDDCDDLVNTIGALLTSLTDALATLASAKASAATDVAALNAQINALWQQQVALNQQIAVTPLGPARDLLVAQANALEAQRNTLLARRDCKQYLVDGADIVTSIVDTTIAQYNTLDANSGGPCTPEQREILQQMIDLLFHALTITVNQIENIAAGCP